jgi:NADH:ubiquinone oxidoreductase subunit E
MEETALKGEKVHDIVQRWNAKPEFLIEMLQDVQEEYRHLPREVLEEIARTIDVPLGRVYHLATFFKGFSLTPRGEHVISVCMGTACHVKGGKRILDAFARELKIQPGGTTKDQQFTLESVRCLGCCGLAPVVTVNEDLYGNLNSTKVATILKKYK